MEEKPKEAQKKGEEKREKVEKKMEEGTTLERRNDSPKAKPKKVAEEEFFDLFESHIASVSENDTNKTVLSEEDKKLLSELTK